MKIRTVLAIFVSMFFLCSCSEIEEMAIEAFDYQKVYYIGDDFSFEGGIVCVLNSDNKRTELNPTQYTVDSSKFNAELVGMYTIIVNYKSLYFNYDVSVVNEIFEVELLEKNEAEIKNVSVLKGTTIDDIFIPKKEGYLFLGWYSDKDLSLKMDKDFSITSNSKFYAKWEPIKYNVIYHLNGGSNSDDNISCFTIETNTFNLTDPIRTNYIFCGWYSDNLFSKPVSCIEKGTIGDIQLYALWNNNEVTIEYEAQEGGYIVGDTSQVIENGTDTTKVEAVAKEGYRFIGWSDGEENAIRNDKEQVESKKISAKFEKIIIIRYEIFDINTGIIEGETYQVITESEPTSAVEAVASLGYIFTKWSDGVLSSKRQDEVFKNDKTIYAIFDFEQFELPILSITTSSYDSILSKEEYVKCIVSSFADDLAYSFNNMSAKIRGRGNSTWGSPKKPFKLKFDKKIDLYGNGSAKTWTLIANYVDKGLINNYMAYSVSNLFEEENYTTSTKTIELYVNNEYMGVYLLCEQVEVEENRVEISNDLASVDTGYLLELDYRAPGEGVENIDYFMSNNDIPFAIKSPDVEDEKFNESFVEYIKKYINDCFSALDSNNWEDVTQVLDVNSFVNMYIVHEFSGCCDVGYSSFYLYKEAEGKLFCGPAWDFDIAFGNCNYAQCSSSEYMWASQKPFYSKLLSFDEFRMLLDVKLSEYAPEIVKTITRCKNEYLSYKQSIYRNFEKWDILGIYVWPNTEEIVSLSTYEEHVYFSLNWGIRKLEYMTGVYCNKA